MDKKKILFLINTLNNGGAEKILVDIVNHLDPNCYDITVKTVIDSGVYRSKLLPHIRYQSIYPGNKLVSYLFSKFFSGKLNAKRFYQKHIADGYDVEVAFLEGFCTKMIAASPNPDKLAWVHTDLYHYYGHKKVFRSITENRDCYRKFKKIVCVSESAKEGFCKQFGEMEQLMVLHNPIDAEAVRKKSSEPIPEMKKDSDGPYVIAVGRLVEQKGFDRLLRIHRRLLDDGIKYHLWIVGEGKQRKQLEDYISENGLNDSVTLLGFRENPYNYIKASDLFVCSSYVEGYSIVLIEALICGRPTVSTNCGGPAEILGDSEYGLLVENDEEALYQGIKKLLCSPQLLRDYHNKAAARGQDFKMEVIIDRIEKIIHF